MISAHIDPATSLRQLRPTLEHLGLRKPAWLLAYADKSTPASQVALALRSAYPDATTFGCTSFRGVCTPSGFQRGVGIFAVEREDALELRSAMRHCNARSARSVAVEACRDIQARLGRRPSMLLMHATPGFEEELLDGVHEAFGTEVPLFGGSAADDDISGDWRVFCDGGVESSGFVLAGVLAENGLSGAFVGGYLPSEHHATVTRAHDRAVLELDGKPAAVVYNDWTNGAIASQLKFGGSILAETNLLPLGRSIQQAGAMPRRLLSHPEKVLPGTQGLTFFSRFREGDEVRLMTNTKGSLIPRMKRATQNALDGLSGKAPPRGGLLVYCAGCLSTTLEDASTIGAQFQQVAGRVPFLGVSTFGEQGTFFHRTGNHHGNLMCSSVVFR